MIAAEQIGAIAPGWVIVALLALLAVAIAWVFLAGEDAEEQIDRLTEDYEAPQSVRVCTHLYDWDNDSTPGGIR